MMKEKKMNEMVIKDDGGSLSYKSIMFLDMPISFAETFLYKNMVHLWSKNIDRAIVAELLWRVPSITLAQKLL